MKFFRMASGLLPGVLILCMHVFASAAEPAGPVGNWPSSTPVDAASPVASGFSSLTGFLKGFDSEPDLLPPEEAFSADIRVRDAKSLIVTFTPVKGYYLYRDRISFKLDEAADIKMAEVFLPDGEMKADPTFGSVAVFHSPFEAVIKLDRTNPLPSGGRVRVSYQGCSELGVCYPPVEKAFDFALPALVAEADDQPAAGTAGAASGDEIAPEVRRGYATPDASVSTRTGGWLNPATSMALFDDGHFGWIVAGFFGFGLLLSLTPCVWPLFPILSGIIAGQGASISRPRAFWLSVSYVLGMAVAYSVMGVVAGLSGSLLSTVLQGPWMLSGSALLFVILALSMFGVYELQLPAFLQNRLASTSGRPDRRTAASVSGMGVLSAIIVGPCVAAPLAGALLYISQTRDVVLGGTALFVMALGKGVPLLLVGTSLGSLLPRSGPWMQSVKVFVGVLLLAAAIWTIAPFLPLPIIMASTGVILVSYAVYLRALDPLPVDAHGFTRLGKGLGVVGLVVGVVYLIGALGASGGLNASSGSRDFLQPLAGMRRTTGQTEVETPSRFERITSIDELDARLQSARGQYVMLDFYADWCVSCKEMEHFTFPDRRVKAKLKNVLLLQADVTANSTDDKRLLSRFGLFGPPGIIFFDRAGQEIKGHRVIGFMQADSFIRVLDDVLSSAS